MSLCPTGAIRKDLERMRQTLKAELVDVNGLGIDTEEVAPKSGKMQGDFPQSLVQAAFVGTAIENERILESCIETPCGIPIRMK